MPSKLLNTRTILTLLLGFSSGLPLALTGTALQAWFTVSNISLVAIGMLGLIGLPYIYKFLWAPLLDYYTPPFLDRRRGWMLITQFGLLISIASMAILQPETHALALSCMALIVAFFSATQDIAIDAYRTEILTVHERGVGAAMYTGGYRIGMLVSSGIGLILADRLGWHETYLIMAALMLVGMICSWWGPTPPVTVTTQTVQLSNMLDPLREFWSRHRALSILLLIVLYKMGEALATSLSTTFLISDLHFSLTSIGSVYKTVAISATIGGVFVGGVLYSRLGLYRSLMWFGILQAVAVLTYMALALIGKNFPLMITAVFLEAFCSGMSTNAFVVLLMSLCNYKYTATQFALLSALAAVGRVFMGPVAAIMVKTFGWPDFFLISFFVAIPSLILLYFLRPIIEAVEQGS